MLKRTIRLLQKAAPSAKETLKDHKPGEGYAHMAKDTSAIFRLTSFELFAKPNMKVAIPGTVFFVGCIGYISYMRYNAEQAVQKGTHSYTYNEEGEMRMGLSKGSRWD